VSQLLILTSARRTDEPWAYLTSTVEQIEQEEIDIPKGIVCDGKYTGPALPPGWTVQEYFRDRIDLLDAKASDVDVERQAHDRGDVLANIVLGPEIRPLEENAAQTLVQGNKKPYWHLLKLAAETGEDVIALEDDLTLCHNAIRRMATLPIPGDLAWLQFFSPKIFQQMWAFIGLWRPPPYSHGFLQAVKFSRRALPTIAGWRDELEWHKYGSSDDTLNLCAMRHGLKYGAHYPDLVQHAGDVSAVAPEFAPQSLKGKLSTCWPGKAFDALSLYRRDDVYR